MTKLGKNPLHRATQGRLDGSFGPDRDRPLVVSLYAGEPGNKDKPDYLLLRPMGTRRPERVNLVDLYRWAIQCRVNAERMAHLRDRKAKKAERLAARRLAAAEKRLVRNLEK